jgi:O-antigen/teichoic acid export membrane protein
VWWNVVALAAAGCLGILFNYLVGVVYGTAALGVFNQVFAVYVLFSQFAALGVHYSVLTHVAGTSDASARQAITTSALLVTLVVGGCFAAVAWLLAGAIGSGLDSAGVAVGIAYAAPGVLFFALSKVTLSCLNALQRMRWYAILSGGRFVLMVAGFAGCVLLEVDQTRLPVILSIAEGATFLLSLVPVVHQLRPLRRGELERWGREHLRFGVRGFLSGMLAELNTRVDILILGAFVSDPVVGAYSFAAILAEGLYQLLVVLRTNYAPIVVKLWAERRPDQLAALVRRVRDRTWLASLVAGAAAIAGYALLVPLVTSDPLLADSWRYFAVLVAGMVASAGYAPFQPLLLYAGKPGWYTILILAIVAINAAGNLALIVPLGAIGSALGTAIAFAAGVLLLRAMSARLLEIRI